MLTPALQPPASGLTHFGHGEADQRPVLADPRYGCVDWYCYGAAVELSAPVAEHPHGVPGLMEQLQNRAPETG
jgi:hypothetical protein